MYAYELGDLKLKLIVKAIAEEENENLGIVTEIIENDVIIVNDFEYTITIDENKFNEIGISFNKRG